MKLQDMEIMMSPSNFRKLKDFKQNVTNLEEALFPFMYEEEYANLWNQIHYYLSSISDDLLASYNRNNKKVDQDTNININGLINLGYSEIITTMTTILSSFLIQKQQQDQHNYKINNDNYDDEEEIETEEEDDIEPSYSYFYNIITVVYKMGRIILEDKISEFELKQYDIKFKQIERKYDEIIEQAEELFKSNNPEINKVRELSDIKTNMIKNNLEQLVSEYSIDIMTMVDKYKNKKNDKKEDEKDNE